jgi:hypothetical protein
VTTAEGGQPAVKAQAPGTPGQAGQDARGQAGSGGDEFIEDGLEVINQHGIDFHRGVSLRSVILATR